MKNYERYADEIKNFDCKNDFCENFVMPYILNSSTCVGTSCIACQLKQIVWLLEKYEEPRESAVDWNQVAVDTPVLVRNYEEDKWEKRFSYATPKWISVNERLPKVEEKVIVTVKDDSADSPIYYTSVGWYYKGIWVVENEVSYQVTAWMPLPKSYKD